MPLYETLDEINAVVKEVEGTLSGPLCKKEGLRISYEHKRICWDGKPLHECRAVDRVEAMFHFHELLKAIDENDSQLESRAREGIAILREWLNKVYSSRGEK
jgi:hypothetical protein